PTINGSSAGFSTSNQQVAVDALLPLNTTLSAAAIGNAQNQLAAMEPMGYVLTSEDLSKPQSCLFLDVIQGFDLGASKLPVSLL
ncbi:hypothetical protein ABTN03_19865, partial [Acinetobacter baumannii]